MEHLHPLEVKVLRVFRQHHQIVESKIPALSGIDPKQLPKVISWLLTKNLLEVTAENITRKVRLTELGKQFRDTGIPELRILDAVKKGARPLSELRKLVNNDLFGKAIGRLKQLGAITITENKVHFVKLPDELTTLQNILTKIGDTTYPWDELSPLEQALITQYSRKRGKQRGIFRIDEYRDRIFSLTPTGKQLLTQLPEEVSKEISQLTPDLLRDGSWRTYKLRPYNLMLPPKPIVVGHRHPYSLFLSKVRQKLLAMGFEEMKGPLVEYEFWNMDALYMPQFHPARQIHDVYFVKSPKYGKPLSLHILERVAAVHRNGADTGSKGWRYEFDYQRAHRLILRSQGTAVSARTLASNPHIPGKYFAIARCFRYDKIDASHLPDFYQIEGIVISPHVNLRTLLGLLKLFAEEFARTTDVEFRPGYFPFTEPSVELHAKIDNKWVELGGAGIFRKEVTHPLGVELPVLAWGLGLDRMAMSALEIKDIRLLFSRDLNFLRQRTKRL